MLARESARSLAATGLKGRVAFVELARKQLGTDRIALNRTEVVAIVNSPDAVSAGIGWPAWLTGDKARRVSRAVFSFDDMLVDPKSLVPEPAVVKVPKVKAPKAQRQSKPKVAPDATVEPAVSSEHIVASPDAHDAPDELEDELDFASEVEALEIEAEMA